MCGRTACTLAPDDVSRACVYKDSKGKKRQPPWRDAPGGQQYRTSYNMAPSRHTPVLVSGRHFSPGKFASVDSCCDETEKDADGSCQERLIMPMKWGLTPSWQLGDPYKVPYETNNCRAEGMLEKKTYKVPLQKGFRCVVLADGFYEWKSGKDGKQPYFFYFPQLKKSDLELIHLKAESSADVKQGSSNSKLAVKKEHSTNSRHHLNKGQTKDIKREAGISPEKSSIGISDSRNRPSFWDVLDKDDIKAANSEGDLQDTIKLEQDRSVTPTDRHSLWDELDLCKDDLPKPFVANEVKPPTKPASSCNYDKVIDGSDFAELPIFTSANENFLENDRIFEEDLKHIRQRGVGEDAGFHSDAQADSFCCRDEREMSGKEGNCGLEDLKASKNTTSCVEEDFEGFPPWTGQKLLTMAAVFDVWKATPASPPLYSYSIITVASSSDMNWCHHRMPAILKSDEEVRAWLDSATIPLDKACSLIKPQECLQYHPVSKEVNNSRNNSPCCVKPIQIGKPKPSASSNLMMAWLKTGSPAKKLKTS